MIFFQQFQQDKVKTLLNSSFSSRFSEKGPFPSFSSFSSTFPANGHPDYTMNKKGKRKKTKKNENVGRPKSAGFWNELPLSQCCYDFVGEEDLSAMASINQNLCKCLCCICQKLMMRPLLILPWKLQVMYHGIR